MLRSCLNAVARPVFALSFTIAFAEQSTYALAFSTPESMQTTSQAPSELNAQQLLQRAHTVFVENDGADDSFPADPNAGYLAFANAMRNWGRYTVVSDVRQADVVIQFRSLTTSSTVASTDDTPPSVVYTPYFRITVAEPAHLTPLWTMTTLVGLGTHKEVNYFDTSVENTLSQVKMLSGTPLTPREQAALRLPDQVRRHAMRTFWIVGGSMVAAAAVGGIVLHHEFAKGVQQQQDQAKQWCIANGFPVIDCEP